MLLIKLLPLALPLAAAMATLLQSDCSQPGKSPILRGPFMEAPLVRRYGTQRVFVQILSERGRYASLLVDVLALDAFMPGEQRWQCGDWRQVLILGTWYDEATGSYRSINGGAVCNLAHTWGASFELRVHGLKRSWNASWVVDAGSATATFEVTNGADVSLTAFDIALVPQGRQVGGCANAIS